MSQLPSSSRGVRAYFAYSHLIDPATFDDWKRKNGHASFQLPEGEVAEAVDVDLFYDSPSKRWGGRIAGLAKRPGSVFGRLYRIRDEDWPIIQRAEGDRGDKVAEIPVTVKVGGKSVQAIAFSTHPLCATTKGPVSESYTQALVTAAERAKLPAEYVERLRAEAEILQKVQAFGKEHGHVQ
jgi:hypothetical protein